MEILFSKHQRSFQKLILSHLPTVQKVCFKMTSYQSLILDQMEEEKKDLRSQFRSDFIRKRLKKPGLRRTYKNRNSKIIKGNIAPIAIEHILILEKKLREAWQGRNNFLECLSIDLKLNYKNVKTP